MNAADRGDGERCDDGRCAREEGTAGETFGAHQIVKIPDAFQATVMSPPFGVIGRFVPVSR